MLFLNLTKIKNIICGIPGIFVKTILTNILTKNIGIAKHTNLITSIKNPNGKRPWKIGNGKPGGNGKPFKKTKKEQ